mmetsp:Transcript_29746/g.70730  ORF Transcript_29746/g.70730 Transcript_29746/m.70730 type:complete len:301 (-) Transcript_29746:452-1354(-)
MTRLSRRTSWPTVGSDGSFSNSASLRAASASCKGSAWERPMQNTFSTASSTSCTVQEAMGASGQATLPLTSTTDSSGRLPAKPAMSWPKITACTVATSWRSVRKHSLLPCFRLLCTRARIQTSWSFMPGFREPTSVHFRPVTPWLWMKTFPKLCSWKLLNSRVGPANLAFLAASASSSFRFLSSSFAFFSASLAFLFSSFLLLPPSSSFGASGLALALSSGVAFPAFASALACALGGIASAFAGFASGLAEGLASRSMWCKLVRSHRSALGWVSRNFSCPAFSAGAFKEHAKEMSATVSR